MDPCSFVKVLVGGLALRIPVASRPTRTGVHPTTSPCFCEIKLLSFPVQTAAVPLISSKASDPDVHNISASFHLEQAELKNMTSTSCFGSSKPCLEIAVYTGRQGSTCGKGWWGSFRSDRKRDRRERKGWLVMIHDLSGSPVAAASMVTPFVPSPGSDRVSRSNPGAWLILRPDHKGEDSWRPWGRLEAWRERGSSGGLGCKFELMAEGGGLIGMSNGLLLSESVISAQKGGKFLIDTGHGRSASPISNSPVSSPHSSGDFNFSLWPFPAYTGFVMSSTVQAERKCSKPIVQLAMRHVTCMEDAAAFVALSAAVDLSMDACQPFSQKLKKELCHHNDGS